MVQSAGFLTTISKKDNEVIKTIAPIIAKKYSININISDHTGKYEASYVTMEAKFTVELIKNADNIYYIKNRLENPILVSGTLIEEDTKYNKIINNKN